MEERHWQTCQEGMDGDIPLGHLGRIALRREQCDMFWPTAVIARQREVKHTSMDMLGSPTVPDGCMASKNGRPQQSDGQCFPLAQSGVI
jgi:hypothetical protein